MLTVARLAVIMSAIALTSAAPAPPTLSAAVVAEFKALCLNWDGDLEATQELVVERGFRPAQERLESFRPGGRPARYTYGWARNIEGVDVQVVAKPRSFIGWGNERFHQDVCSIVVNPGHRTSLRNEVAHELDQDSFRQAGASVFAWTQGPNGKAVVPRRIFDTRLYRLMRDGALRIVTVADHNDKVILSYFVPSREDCLYRPNYTAIEANIVCGAARDEFAAPET